MADVSIKTKSFLSYLTEKIQGRGSESSLQPNLESIPYIDYNNTYEVKTSYVDDFVHKLFQTDVTIVPERVTYSVGTIVERYNMFYNRIEELGKYWDCYPIVCGNRKNSGNYNGVVTLNLVSGTNQVVQTRFETDSIYTRTITATSTNMWYSTDTPTAWTQKYWGVYNGSTQVSDHNQIATNKTSIDNLKTTVLPIHNTVSMNSDNWMKASYAISGVDKLYYASINFSKLCGLTTTATDETIRTTMAMKNRYGTSYTTRADIQNVFDICSQKSGILRDSNTGTTIDVEYAGDVWILTANKSFLYSDGTATQGAPQIWNINITGANTSSTQYSLRQNPLKLNVYNINSVISSLASVKTTANYAYNMSFALTYTQNQYASIKGWGYLMALTPSSSSTDIFNALNLSNRFQETIDTSAKLKDNLDMCSTNGFILKERYNQGKVNVEKNGDLYMLSGLSNQLNTSEDGHTFGVLVSYNVNLVWDSGSSVFRIPDYATPQMHSLYTV